ncbi:MAG: AsmA family protein, partial [Thermodesulfobacteriota bacterium]
MRWKWILGVIAFLTLALLITIYIVLSSYNFNKLKPLITQAAKDATGRELILGGDIDLKIGFSPALSVEDVSFQNAPWGSRSELARLKRLEVQISLLPLIGGNIKIKRLILIEPDILIERGKGGKLNIEFDLQEKIAAAVPEEESVEEEIKLPALTFNKLLIEKGRITYRDDRTGKTYAVKLDRLAANRKDIRGSLEMELRGDYNGEHFEVYGTLGPLASLSDPDKAW